MDIADEKIFKEITRLLEFLKRSNSRELRLRAYELAVRLEVPESKVWDALAWFATFGSVRLSTWSEWFRREITFQEWPAAGFFNNSKDCNYVRLRPAEL